MSKVDAATRDRILQSYHDIDKGPTGRAPRGTMKVLAKRFGLSKRAVEIIVHGAKRRRDR